MQRGHEQTRKEGRVDEHAKKERRVCSDFIIIARPAFDAHYEKKLSVF